MHFSFFFFFSFISRPQSFMPVKRPWSIVPVQLRLIHMTKQDVVQLASFFYVNVLNVTFAMGLLIGWRTALN